MINLNNPEHFAQVMQFAVSEGLAAQLVDRLEYLSNYTQGAACFLYADFAPHSFVFNIVHADGKVGMCGGLIWSEHDHKWSVHT